MKNITLAVDEDVLAKVRRIAAEQDTTVNALVREYLTRMAQEKSRADRVREELVKLSDESEGRMGEDYQWDREAIYDRPILSGHERPVLRGDGEGRRSRKKTAGA